MSAYAADRTARTDKGKVEALDGGRYKVHQAATLESPVEVNLSEGPWSPARFAALARAALGSGEGRERSDEATKAALEHKARPTKFTPR